MNLSKRTLAATTTFGAYFAAQTAMQFTVDGTILGTLGVLGYQLYATYEILITQPAATPNIPPFPASSPNDMVLDNAIATAATAIGSLNTTVQALTLSQAQAAATARAQRNSYPGAVSQAIGFLYADAAIALVSIQQITAALLGNIKAAQGESDDE